MFKPITETQKDIKESLVSELRPIKEILKELPAAPQLQAIAAPPEDEDEEGVMQVGKIAHKYLSDYAAKQNVDKTFGIYKNPLDKLSYIGCRYPRRQLNCWRRRIRRHTKALGTYHQ